MMLAGISHPLLKMGGLLQRVVQVLLDQMARNCI